MATRRTTAPTALDGIRVIDLSDELAAYTGRLLTDLGADVIRVEPPNGSSTRRVGPIVVEPERPGISMFDRFVNAGKRSITLDPTETEGRELLERLLTTADVVIESPRPQLEQWLGPDRVAEFGESFIRVIVTPFGLDHQPEWDPADDLLVMADGGLLHLGGYPDVGPVVAYGGQSRFAASIFGAVAAVSAVMERDLTGVGGVYDISAQECVAQALEDSAATYALTGRVRERQGDRAREAGSGTYACRDGYVSMVAGRLGTAKAWSALIAWLNEEKVPGAEQLLEPRWGDFAFRQTEEAIEEFRRVFERFAGQHDKADLYDAAQARMIALSPVNTVEDVMDSPQLRARGFFVEVPDRELPQGLVFPRAPYRLSVTPALPPTPAPRVGEDNLPILVGELGLTSEEYIGLRERGVV